MSKSDIEDWRSRFVHGGHGVDYLRLRSSFVAILRVCLRIVVQTSEIPLARTISRTKPEKLKE